MEKKQVVSVLFVSLLLTACIIGGGLVVNYFFDTARLGLLDERLASVELNVQSYLLKGSFDSQAGISCIREQENIDLLDASLHNFGADLDRYSTKATFKKGDFDFLKRQYILMEAEFYLLLVNANAHCNENYLPVLFFFKGDEGASIDQGLVLREFSTRHKGKVFGLAFDSEYSKEPVIGLLMRSFGITETPAMVMGQDVVSNGWFIDLEALEARAGAMFENKIDKHGRGHDFGFVLNATGTSRESLLKLLDNASSAASAFAKGDISLVRGRMTGNDSLICEAARYYANVTGINEERALALESAASLGCHNDSMKLYSEAAVLWKKSGYDYRAKVDQSLAAGRRIPLSFSEYPLYSNLSVPVNASFVAIGSSSVEVGNGSVITTQVDRVRRDWLSGQLSQSPFGHSILTTFSERLTYNSSELRSDIGWHEGGRLKQIVSGTNASYFAATGTIVRRVNGSWFAANEDGVAMFDVPIDKLLYPTTRFLQDDLAVIVDTHGVNMLVAQSVLKKASVVVSDCDNPGKVKAALYLASRNISVVCFPDKFLFMALGRSSRILGSPPVKVEGGKAVIGRQPVRIALAEPLIVMNASNAKFALWYYQTPASYFSEMQKYVKLNITYVTVTDFGRMGGVIAEARRINSSVIAARVFNSDDYRHLSGWLNESRQNRAILFHSASYPYGALLLKEYPGQVGFDDISPEFS